MSTPAPRVAGHWKRELASVARWSHIYISMLSFGLLLFFSVTGITLNHAEKFGKGSPPRQVKGQLKVDWVKVSDAQVARLEIVEYLRRTHGVRGFLGEIRLEEDQCTVSFKGPGYSADAFITRATGAYELTETRLGWVAVLNDLHKGRDSGPTWSWLIDATAILLTVVALSGLLLMGFVKRRRVSGFALAVAGTVVIYLLYLIVVP